MSQIQFTDLSVFNFSLNNIPYSNSSKTETSTETEEGKNIKGIMRNLPFVLNEKIQTEVQDGTYNITLKQFTDLTSYNNVMSSLYGNNSSDSFQNLLNKTLDTYEDNLANAKSFVDKLKSEGMTNKEAVNTYNALQKYSQMTSSNNYNFVNTQVS